jgi:hypothetical protein
MHSTTVIVAAITSGIGFLLNGTVLFLVLLRGRQKYHYLFAGIPLILAIWDIGIFLTMIRNSHIHELPVYGHIVGMPCAFIPALIYHFTCKLPQSAQKKEYDFYLGLLFDRLYYFRSSGWI